MMYFRRDFICERLRLSLRQSYRIVGSSRSGLISSTSLLQLLNRSRRGITDALAHLPSDITTPDEAAKRTGVPSTTLRRWAKRVRNVPPHFALNHHTIRFPMRGLFGWLEENSNPRRFS